MNQQSIIASFFAVALAAWPAVASQEIPGSTTADSAGPQVPSSNSAPQNIDHPDWERTPAGQELGKLYPAQTQPGPREGLVKMKCFVKADGTLRDCTVIFEEPKNQGFGTSTLEAAKYFKMRTAVEGATVIIPIRWRLAK